VNIVRNGKIKKIITTIWGWKADRLCCTKSGDMLVSMFSAHRNKHKIIRYQEHRVTQETYRDKDGERIYKRGKWPMCLVENNNGDICASDLNANTVVVVKKSGRVRFHYDGTRARRKKLFYPGNLMTDTMSQIIVADDNNACLHILD
jgi:hypothetical protein